MIARHTARAPAAGVSSGWLIIVVCPFVQAWLARHLQRAAGIIIRPA